jgi:hypothetical protein
MRTYQEMIDEIISGGIVHNIGQIEKNDLRLLDKAVKAGMISKGIGGEFPALKNVYAPNGFDFTKHRNAVVDLVDKVNENQISPIEYIKHRFDYHQFITI